MYTYIKSSISINITNLTNIIKINTKLNKIHIHTYKFKISKNLEIFFFCILLIYYFKIYVHDKNYKM